VGWLHGCIVAVFDTEWEPSLLALWVLSHCQVEILIDFLKNCTIGALVVDEILEKDDLKVAIEFIGEVLVVLWGRFTCPLNILVSEEVGEVGTLGGEVCSVWRKSRSIEPTVPVDRCEDSIGIRGVEIILNKVFPFPSYHIGLD